jgi:hypothetical protein
VGDLKDFAQNRPIGSAVGMGVPIPSLEVYARWWQLETYLREVAYTELRSAYGRSWTSRLGDAASLRAERDRVNSYMASVDAEELLGYADFGALLRLLDAQWALFEETLLPRTRWSGLSEELSAIRNRSAHCRRPHADDTARLEQALRNLEPGARQFYASYSRTWPVPRRSKDRLARAWAEGRHPAAERLLDHTRRKYGTQFRLEWSLRPWAERDPDPDRLSEARGLLWHATWVLSEEPDPVEVWRTLSSDVRDLLVHLIFDGVVVHATFSSSDGASAIADSIGTIFDRLLTTARRSGAKEEEGFHERWEAARRAQAKLPLKAQVGGLRTYFDHYDPEKFPLFDAGPY